MKNFINVADTEDEQVEQNKKMVGKDNVQADNCWCCYWSCRYLGLELLFQLSGPKST